MKYQNLLAAAILIFVLGGCCKEDTVNCNMIAADILRYDCDRVILKLNSIDMIGDAQWTDEVTGETYSNVVWYRKGCRIAELTRCVEKRIYLVLSATEDDAPVCPVECQAVSQSPPQQQIFIREATLNGCAPEQ